MSFSHLYNQLFRFYSRVYDWAFDYYLGVATRRLIEVSSMNLSSEDKTQAHRYEPVPYLLLQSIFSQISQEDLSPYTFIDYGCGKGRVLRMACQYKFKKIVGVEIDFNLVQICLQNLKPNMKNHEVEIVHMNARELSVSAHPSIHFFFNPFEWPVFDAVLDRVLSAAIDSPEQWLIMVNPAYIEQVRAKGFVVVNSFKLKLCAFEVKILKPSGAVI